MSQAPHRSRPAIGVAATRDPGVGEDRRHAKAARSCTNRAWALDRAQGCGGRSRSGPRTRRRPKASAHALPQPLAPRHWEVSVHAGGNPSGHDHGPEGVGSRAGADHAGSGRHDRVVVLVAQPLSTRAGRSRLCSASLALHDARPFHVPGRVPAHLRQQHHHHVTSVNQMSANGSDPAAPRNDPSRGVAVQQPAALTRRRGRGTIGRRRRLRRRPRCRACGDKQQECDPDPRPPWALAPFTRRSASRAFQVLPRR